MFLPTMTVIAIDLGGTKLAGAVVSADGALLHRESVRLDGRGGADVAALVRERCDALRARALTPPEAVGVTVPGIYRAERGTVWAPNVPGWDDYPLRDELRRAYGAEMTVVIDSDRGIGWLALDRPFREEYAGCGCFEYHASGPGLAKVARALLAEDPEYAG